MPDWTSPLAHTYAEDRPEPYFASFARLGYVQPDHIVAIAERLLPAIGGGPILDVGCGYGTIGAVARHFGSMAALLEGAAGGVLERPEALPRRTSPFADETIVGLDPAAPAVRFAEAAGFIDRGVTDDLTAGPPSEVAAAAIRPCRLVMEAGVEWTALGALLPNLLAVFGDDPPIFLLGPRGDAPTIPVFAALEAAGYDRTRLTEAPLRFRRFQDEEERIAAAAREDEAGATAPSDEVGYLSHLFLFTPPAGMPAAPQR